MTRKIRYKRLIVFFLVLIVVVLLVIKLFSLKITNIYVSGNNYLSDQYIIEIANLENYPTLITSFSNSIESRIRASIYVSDVDVKKRFNKIYITVVENKPLFYDELNRCTVFSDGSKSSDILNVPILTSNVNSDVYTKFLNNFSLIDSSVFSCISEIKYVPNEVDNELFLLTMNDGNYVYVNLDKFETINKYFGMIINFNNHKGILYLDSGEYFKILDN